MLKIITSIVFITIGTFIGMQEALKLSSRALFWEQFSDFLTYIKGQIRYSSESITDIIKFYNCPAKLSFLKNITEGNLLDNNLSSLWENAVNSIPKSSGLKANDLSLLKKFGSGLGISDTEGELSHCDLYISLSTQRLHEAQEEKRKKYKLYQILGISFGICTALLFI